MTGKKQTNYERIARELFDRLVDMAWECDSLFVEVSVHTTEMSPDDPRNAPFSMLERHTIAARGLATGTLLTHEVALKKDLTFPWIGKVLDAPVDDDDEGES